MHPLLERQLKALGLSEKSEQIDGATFQKLLERVSAAYEGADRSRERLVRSLELSSSELLERNERLERDLAERTRVESALRDSQQRLKLHTENTPLGVIEWDLRWHVTEWNHAAEEIFGFTREEILGKRSAPLIVPTPEEERVNSVRDGLVSGDGGRRSTNMNTRKDGTLIYCEWYNTPLYDEQGNVLGFASIVQDITTQIKTQEALLNASYLDELTGLANRRHLYDVLRQSLARLKRHPQYQFAVLLMDLDRFKVLNDSLGHAYGDLLLQRMAERLRTTVRTNDLAARIGGDEFAVLLDSIGGEKDAVLAAERVLNVLAEPFTLGTHSMHFDVSIGIAVGSSVANDPEELLRNADLALYRAKAQGGRRCSLFDEAMHASAVQRMNMETELLRALDGQVFQLHYQPIVHLETGTIVGAEALLRWPHAQRGMISPAEFIPVAEEIGLIDRIGNWVLEEACRQVSEWEAILPEHFNVSINISARQFSDGLLAERLRQAFARFGVPRGRVAVELTESAMLHSLERVSELIAELRSLGVSVYLDDFGTGFSSLSHLHRLPVDSLKIDRSFVQGGTAAQPILTSIAALSQQLYKRMIAEGVERPAERDMLRRLGCEYAQGWLYARAMPAAQLASLLRTRLGPAELYA